MPVVNSPQTGYVVLSPFASLAQLNLYVYIGITNKLSRDPDPAPILSVPSLLDFDGTNKDDDAGDVSGPAVNAHVDLAKTVCELIL